MSVCMHRHHPFTLVTHSQTIGCIIMGGVSDRFGRRPVMLCCLAASFCSLSVVARAKTLPQVRECVCMRMYACVYSRESVCACVSLYVHGHG